jgi:hypothetical protein
MNQFEAVTAPAELSQGRKYAIFFTLIVKMVVNMQQVAKRFKALKTELSKQRQEIRGYVPDPKELLTQYSKILSDISGVPHDEMRLFVKEYIKDHLKKKIKNVSIDKEKAEEVLYNTALQALTVKGLNTIEHAGSKFKTVDETVSKKLFQSKSSARLDLFVEVNKFISTEMSTLVGCSVDELDQTQYVLLSSIIDEL